MLRRQRGVFLCSATSPLSPIPPPGLYSRPGRHVPCAPLSAAPATPYRGSLPEKEISRMRQDRLHIHWRRNHMTARLMLLGCALAFGACTADGDDDRRSDTVTPMGTSVPADTARNRSAATPPRSGDDSDRNRSGDADADDDDRRNRSGDDDSGDRSGRGRSGDDDSRDDDSRSGRGSGNSGRD